MALFESKAERAARERAADLERYARDEDRDAYQHLLWAKSFARDGDMKRMRSAAANADLLTAHADELRRKAEQLRRKR
jgi:hypothetical protein